MYIVKIIENYYAEFYRLPRCLINSGIEYINCVILKSLVKNYYYKCVYGK